jgi:hypothetical protein
VDVKRRRISTAALTAVGMSTAFLGIAPPCAFALEPDRGQFFPYNTNPDANSRGCAQVSAGYLGLDQRHGVSAYAQAITRCTGTGGGYAAAGLYNSHESLTSVTVAVGASSAVRTVNHYNIGRATCFLPGSRNHAAHKTQCVSRYIS